jgi:chemotaxis protein methyltransferase CheR
MKEPVRQWTRTQELKPLVGPLSLSRHEFTTVATLAREQFGVELGEGKEQLVAARLGKLMRHLGFPTFRSYFDHVRADHSGEALVQLIDALTTNHTSFFREQAHFDFLINRIFPEWKEAYPRRIWSAASATGEEPYTIALVAREYFGAQSMHLPRILASDISSRALETARNGVYPASRLQGVLSPWLGKHLLRGLGRWNGWYRLRPEIRPMVEFRRINLIEQFLNVGRFSLIFCRNVMIYFGPQTQEQLVCRLSDCLEPGGHLFIGHAESLNGIHHDLQHVQPAIYRKRGGQR